MAIEQSARLGLRYTIELVRKRDCIVVSSETEHNLTPNEGIALMQGLLFAQTPAPAAWYVGLYQGDYDPTPGVTAATLNALAQECTAYIEPTRPQFTAAAAGVGITHNEAARAEFSFAGDLAIRGGFLSSSPTKGSAAGTLLSIVKFPTVKNVTADFVLRVRAGLILTSL